MHKIIIHTLLIIACGWLLTGRAQADSSPRALLLEYFANTGNWQTTGNVWLEPADQTRNPLATGTLHLQPHEATAAAQINNYDGQEIPLSSEYALTFAFSLTNYSLGDSCRWIGAPMQTAV